MDQDTTAITQIPTWIIYAIGVAIAATVSALWVKINKQNKSIHTANQQQIKLLVSRIQSLQEQFSKYREQKARQILAKDDEIRRYRQKNIQLISDLSVAESKLQIISNFAMSGECITAQNLVALTNPQSTVFGHFLMQQRQRLIDKQAQIDRRRVSDSSMSTDIQGLEDKNG